MALTRSEHMSRIKDKNTRPELFVRKILRELGFKGYRLHCSKLPGKPDVVFISRRKVIFVHGCFWHGHNCQVGLRRPKSNQSYWLPKIQRNQTRDSENILSLQTEGWQVLVIWDCELNDADLLKNRIVLFMS